jgi:anthranilate synthase component 1
MQADLDTPLAIDAAPLPASCEEDDPQRFLTGVARIHEHLRDGDIFQVKLSREWRARYAKPPAPA